MSRQTFTRFLRNPSKKIRSAMFKTEGGGSKAFWTMFKKTTNLVTRGFPYHNVINGFLVENEWFLSKADIPWLIFQGENLCCVLSDVCCIFVNACCNLIKFRLHLKTTFVSVKAYRIRKGLLVALLNLPDLVLLLQIGSKSWSGLTIGRGLRTWNILIQNCSVVSKM